MNRNVMVSHQKTCHLNNETTTTTLTTSLPMTPTPTLNVVLSTTDISLQPPPEKRSKLVLNSDEIKNLIMAKDEEIRKQEEANRNRISAELAAKISSMPVPMPALTSTSSVPMVTIPTSILMQEQPDIKHEPIDAEVNDDDDEDLDDDEEDLDDDDEEGVDPLENSLKPNLKPVVRKRAPVFPFEVNSPFLSVSDHLSIRHQHLE